MLVMCSGTVAAQEYVWRFVDGDVGGWNVINASPERDAFGYVLVRQNDPFWIVSPQNLNIAAEVSYFEFRIKTTETFLNGYVTVKTRDNRSWNEPFSFGLPNAFHIYRINLQRNNRTGSPIDAVALAFGKVDRVWLDYVRFFKPSPGQRIRMYWEEFWDVPLTNDTTVNFVTTPLLAEYSFLLPLYGLILLITICLLALQKSARATSLSRALILSCVVAGLLFTLRMDYAWYMKWRTDRELCGRKSYDELISCVDGTGSYDFAKSVKQNIPADSTAMIFAGPVEGTNVKLKYYLLPIMVSRSAPYIAVYKDPSVFYDPVQKTLKRGSVVVATDAQLVMAAGKDGYIYRASTGGQP